MKAGINLLLWTVHPKATEHGRLLEQIKSWGYDGVEFPLAAASPAELAELAKLADGLDLARTGIQGLNARDADPISPDPKLRRAAVEELKRGVDKTRIIGSEIFAGPVFQGLGRFSGIPPTRDEWKWSVEVIREVAEYAASMHVRLALEPLNRFEMYLVNTLSDGVRFCREVGLPNVGLLADTHHSNIEEENTANAWRKHAEFIFHVHISENHRGVPGRGHAIPTEVFLSLLTAGYDEWLTIEAFSPKVEPLVPRLHVWRDYFENEEDVAVEGLRFIREGWEAAAARR